MKPALIFATVLAWPLAAASALASDNATLTDTLWVKSAPSFAEVAAAYPQAARDKGLAGRVLLSCAFNAFGRLGHCDTINEIPMGAGFARAALGLVGRFEGPTELANGHNIAGTRAQFWIRFDPDMLKAATVTAPEWAALPTAGQFQQAFPDAASKAGVLKARAAMSCKVGPDGGLAGCAAVSEDPAGYGFGAATLPLAPLFRLKLWGADGRPVAGGEVRVPIRYDLQQAPAPRS